MFLKYLATALVAIALLACLAPTASALDLVWVVQLRASNPDGGAGVNSSQYGTGTPAVACSGLQDSVVMVSCPDRGGSDPRWTKEIRAAAQSASVVMTWNLRVEAGAKYVGDTFKLCLWNPTGSSYDIDANPGFRLRFYKGSSLEYGFSPAQNGTSAAPQWTKLYSITAGQVIDDFRLVRELPEPAGVVSLLIGLGISGSALQRRRR